MAEKGQDLSPVIRELQHRVALTAAVDLLRRVVTARVLAHAGPEGLEAEARRLVDWHDALPADQRELTRALGERR